MAKIPAPVQFVVIIGTIFRNSNPVSLFSLGLLGLAAGQKII